MHAANGTKNYGVVSPYPSTRGTSLSNVLTAAILAAGVDGGPSVDIGKPMAIHKTTTRIKMDNKHQCCRRKWTPEKEKNQHCSISQPAPRPDTAFCFQDCWYLVFILPNLTYHNLSNLNKLQFFSDFNILG